jgi:hypothetical protein
MLSSIVRYIITLMASYFKIADESGGMDEYSVKLFCLK